ncbi:MAG: NADH-quinone oxidoreductase subunit N [Anaerolineales bacterium]|nr:NADH-quinone oxidoreductase subunit N [Anaerolineales bacterium]
MNLIPILPEILILTLAILVLTLEPFWKQNDRRGLGWLTAGGLFLTLALSLLFGRPGEPVTVLGGMLRFDWLGFFFKMLFIIGGAATALFLMDMEKINRRGEAYVLLLASLLGMNLMAASANLVMLYLAIETTSIPLYVLAGFLRSDDKSTEAGFKYLLFGALTSAIMLYGFSLLYGFTGTTDIYALAAALPKSLFFGIAILLLAGLGFKVSAVPFHFWTPDVYEGAPTPVTGFLSTVSKAAGFAVVLRLFIVAFPLDAQAWSFIFAILSAVTMTLGNLLAISQKNIKRMLAYSSIAHAGYTLIGVAAIYVSSAGLSDFSVASVIFYLLVYIVTNLLAFGLVIAFARVVGSDEIPAYNGLSRRHPWLALGMLTAMLSLAGMPPFGGFIAKVLVFAAAVKVGLVWLAFVGIVNSIIGAYYYLIVIKHVYLYRDEAAEDAPLPVTRPYALALVVLALGVILLGTVFAPWFDMSAAGALNLF